MSHNIHIGILGAMPEEVGESIKHLRDIKEKKFGDLKIFEGTYINKKNISIKTSIAWSGWGKVSSARAATRLIAYGELINSPIDLLIFTGVAGSTVNTLKQWDIVIPDLLIQYDMDARPIFPHYVIPALNTERIKIKNALKNWSRNIINEEVINGNLKEFGKLLGGTIATGDKFITEKKIIENLKKDIPDLVAVEMEGAAVAQVARQENLDFLIIRVISDEADENAAESFGEFLKKYNTYSWKIIESLLKKAYELNL